jgi:Flp pilus assembly protein TadB
VSAGFISWVLALALFTVWLVAMITQTVPSSLVHLLLATSVGIVLVRILRRQRRQHG